MKLEDKHKELAPIIKGSSFNQIFNWFYQLAQIRYATKEHLNFFNNKIGTPKKLKALTDEGFLLSVNDYFFTAPKTLKILQDNGFDTGILQHKFTGEVGKHQKTLSSVIFEIMKEPFFYRVFYPKLSYKGDTRYIEPDACLIFKDGDKAKVEFLEVENEKPDWFSHLQSKHDRYKIKAQDYNLFEWWKIYAEKMKLESDEFCFSIRCYSAERYEWEGWNWKVLA